VTKRFGPGDRVPDSGIYRNVRSGDRVTVNRGDRFPPTPKPNQSYRPERLTDPRHRRGQ
jgi:YjzC-like protein